MALDPQRSNGVPLNPHYRLPAPGANDPALYDDPVTAPAGDIADNPYWKRDVRRSYPALSVVGQADVSGLLALGSAATPKVDLIGEAGEKAIVAATSQGGGVGGLAVALEARLSTARMRELALDPYRLAASDTRHLYWTPAQMVAQHTLGGCNLRPGDLLGSGTISTPDDGGHGSLLELTRGGTRPIELPSGETRLFLEAGDEILLTAYCQRDGYPRIGFGESRARIID